MAGALEGDVNALQALLRRRSHSGFVMFLREFLTERDLLPPKLPDLVEYREQRILKQMETISWEGLCDEDQARMREFLTLTCVRCKGKTVIAYRDALNYLHTAMRAGQLSRLGDVRPEHVNLLIEQLEAKGLRKRTQYGIMNFLKTFFMWLVEEKGYPGCPILQRHFPRYYDSDPDPLSSSQVGRLREVLDSRFIGSMHRAFFYLIYLTGLRVSEAVGVRLCDIDRERRELFVARGKGGKTAYLPIATYAIDRIDEWIARSPLPQGCEHVFHRNGVQISNNETIRIEIVDAADVQFTWHQLRTTFATRLAEHRVGAFQIQKLLRHRRLNTIMRYINMADTRVREGYMAFAEQLVSNREVPESACFGTAIDLLDAAAQ